jgi:hypothetical protein
LDISKSEKAREIVCHSPKNSLISEYMLDSQNNIFTDWLADLDISEEIATKLLGKGSVACIKQYVRGRRPPLTTMLLMDAVRLGYRARVCRQER